MFDPKTKRFPYPMDTSAHYIKLKMDRGISIDKDYPYVDNSFSFKFKQFWVRLLLVILVFPITRIRLGLRIKNKHILRYNSKLLKNGFVSAANHVHFWDYIVVMRVVHRFSWPNVIVWDKNINGENGPLIRMVGGIPIPKSDNESTLKFVKSVDNLLQNNRIVNVYPEGSMWEYYKPIRPFHFGAASFALKNNKPILPLAFSYRKPGWIRRKIFKQIALFNVNIGEPILSDPELEKNKQLKDLTIKMHEEMCRLSGNENNLYEPIYDDSKRIDYY